MNFTVASTPRFFDRQAGEWRDGEALFLRCSCWRQLAEHVSESLTRGMRVIVQGRLRQRSFETKEGEKRTVVEMEADEVGPALRYATATVTKAQRNSNAAAASGQHDPWAAPATPAAGADDPGGRCGRPTVLTRRPGCSTAPQPLLVGAPFHVRTCMAGAGRERMRALGCFSGK